MSWGWMLAVNVTSKGLSCYCEPKVTALTQLTNIPELSRRFLLVDYLRYHTALNHMAPNSCLAQAYLPPPIHGDAHVSDADS
jgi:hypothetical protein